MRTDEHGPKTCRLTDHMIREAVDSGACRMAKEDTETNLSDIFTKVIPRPRR